MQSRFSPLLSVILTVFFDCAYLNLLPLASSQLRVLPDMRLDLGEAATADACGFTTSCQRQFPIFAF